MGVITRHHRSLQRCDDVRVVHVVFATVHVLKKAALVERLAGIPRARGELFHIGFEIREVCALHTTLGSREAQVHDLVGQAHDLEQL